VLLPDGEAALGVTVQPRDIEALLDAATGASAHTSRDSIRQGFVTAPGGIRIGLCGTAIAEDGRVTGFRSFSSAAVRIPREVVGSSDGIFQKLTEGGFFSTVIISPPGFGKTTVLRDLVRALSDRAGCRIALADERGEVAAAVNGRPGMNVGAHTDVLDGCPKATAVMLLLRGMNPQIIAIDEITSPEDVAAMEIAANCGVQLLATAHGRDAADLSRRPVYRKLLELGVFRRAVKISREAGKRTYDVEEIL
jgi:stage III sporulation protein AA